MTKLKLSDKQIMFLESMPEQGMGYHIVDIKLVTGEILKNRIVLNCEFLKLNECELINLDKIEEISLSQM